MAALLEEQRERCRDGRAEAARRELADMEQQHEAFDQVSKASSPQKRLSRRN